VIAVDIDRARRFGIPARGGGFRDQGEADALYAALVELGVRNAVLMGTHGWGGVGGAARRQPNRGAGGRLRHSAAEICQHAAARRAVCWPVIGPALDRFRVSTPSARDRCRH
jgi:hypothetical protein